MGRTTVGTGVWLVVAGLCGATGCIGVSATKPGAASAQLRQCPGGVVVTPDGLIDDFEDGDNKTADVAGRGGYWWKSTDSAGSFFGPEDWGPVRGGPDGSLAMHPVGETASGDPTEAWGAQIGGNFTGSGFYDASQYVGVSLWAKVAPGKASTLRFEIADGNTHPTGEVCDSCWNHFGKTLQLTTEWKEYRILFSDLRQDEGWGDPRPLTVDVSRLYSLNFKLLPGSVFDFWVDNLQFLSCE